MSDWRKFDCLFVGLGETPRSFVSESVVDFVVNFAVEPLAIARQRWRCEPELISGERDHER